MGIVFRNKTILFWIMVSFGKTKDGWMTWIVKRNEKKFVLLYWTNEFFKRYWQKRSLFTKRTIFWNTLFRKILFVLLTKRFFPKNDSFFYWTIVFIERTVFLNYRSRKMNKKDRKLTILLRTIEKVLKKRTKWIVHKRWTKEMNKKPNAPISRYTWSPLFSSQNLKFLEP